MLKKHTVLTKITTVLLCVSLLLSDPTRLYASGDGAGSGEPVSDPHTEFYQQAPDTDSTKGWPAGPLIEAESAVLMDVNTEAILYSKNADKQQYPASITKIMTALLGCENLDFSQDIVMSESAAYGIEPGSSSIYGDTGEVFTAEQVMMALMLESANEMALIIGEQIDGSTKKFVERMNRRARELGCTNTHFNNPNGLPDETHYTTANDMAKIAKAAWLNPMFRRYCTTDYYEIPPTNVQPETRYLLNHHGMMSGKEHSYEGVLGGKTGYTKAAGNTLVTYARRGNLTLVAVVMKSVNGAYSDTAALLDYGFQNFERINVRISRNPALRKMLPCEKYVLNNGGNTYPFYAVRAFYATVPTGTKLRKLTKKQALLPDAVGLPRLKSRYYFNGRAVGWAMQYQREILSDLLL